MTSEEDGALTDAKIMERVRNSLSVGHEYKYKELCEVFCEDEKNGTWQRDIQKEGWSRFIAWENPTKQRYRITAIFDSPKPREEDGRKHNGGKRVGAGRKPLLQDEFDYLVKGFFHQWANRNMYDGYDLFDVHFSNTEAGLYFGILTDEILKYEDSVINWVRRLDLSASKSEKLSAGLVKAAGEVYAKLREKVQSLVINKMRRIEDMVLEHGILAYIDSTSEGLAELKKEYKRIGWSDSYYRNRIKEPDKPDHRNDLLDRWCDLSDIFVKHHGFKGLHEVAEKDMWSDMLEFVSSRFLGYRTVLRVWRFHPIESGGEDLPDAARSLLEEFDLDELESMRLRMNAAVADALEDYFMGKVDDPTYHILAINHFVRVGDERRLTSGDLSQQLDSDSVTAGMLTDMLKCTTRELKAHIDWLGVEPTAMLEKLRSHDGFDFSSKLYRGESRRGAYYWKDLKNLLHGEKVKGVFWERGSELDETFGFMEASA